MLGNNSGRSSDEELLGGPHNSSTGNQNPGRFCFPPIPANLATAHCMSHRPPPTMGPHIMLPPVHPSARHLHPQQGSMPLQAGLLELYGQIQEMDTRIRQLEMIVYNNQFPINPNMMGSVAPLVASTSADSVEEPPLTNNTLHQEDRMIQVPNVFL